MVFNSLRRIVHFGDPDDQNPLIRLSSSVSVLAFGYEGLINFYNFFRSTKHEIGIPRFVVKVWTENTPNGLQIFVYNVLVRARQFNDCIR